MMYSEQSYLNIFRQVDMQLRQDQSMQMKDRHWSTCTGSIRKLIKEVTKQVKDFIEERTN